MTGTLGYQVKPGLEETLPDAPSSPGDAWQAGIWAVCQERSDGLGGQGRILQP